MHKYSFSITLGSFAGEALLILLRKFPPIFSQTQGPFAHVSWNLSSFISEAPGQAKRFSRIHVLYILQNERDKRPPEKVKSECILI
jgi:hypothetical protein